MKKVLVITLALVMAFATSAMAAVNFSGEFKAEIANEGGFFEGLAVKPTLTVNIGAAAGDEANWNFEAKSSLSANKFELGEYKLELLDDYFDLYFWGHGKKLSDKGTTLGLIKAAEQANTHRARLVVDAIEPVTLTADFTQGNLYVFADANVQGYDVGAAFKKNGDDHTVGIWGKGSVDIVTLQADVAATLPPAAEEDVEGAEEEGPGLALGYAAKATVKVTDEVSVWAQYLGSQDGFKGDMTKASEVSAGATYQDTALKVTGKVTHDLDGEKNTIEAGADYRFSDAVGFGDLYKDDKYYNNNAPAVGVATKLVDFELEHVTLNAASPVVADMVWAKAMAKYAPVTTTNEADEEETAHNMEFGAYAHVKATDKLTFDPSVTFTTKDSKLGLNVKAGYLIGSSNVKLNLEVGRTQVLDSESDVKPTEKLAASVTVKF